MPPGRSRGHVRIDGIRPVIEAIRAGRRRVYEVTLPPHSRTPGLRELVAVVEEHGIPLRRPQPGDAQVHASAAPYPEESCESLLADAGQRMLVALDAVTDVGNLGSIARSAEVAGVMGLILEHRRAASVTPGALRASAGALEHLRVARTPNLARALSIARGEGFTVLAATPGGEPLEAIAPEALAGGLIWVLGSEDRGLRARVRRTADREVGIRLRGEIGSLGVAAAAAFLLLRTAELRDSWSDRSGERHP